MTKKDYIKIANVFKRAINTARLSDDRRIMDLTIRALIESFGDMFKADNYRFDNDRFIDYINSDKWFKER